MTGEKNHQKYCPDTCETCKEVASSLFEAEALVSLNWLIEKIQAFAPLSIILSSNWRCGHPLGEIKEILSQHKFSELIVGKTREMIANDAEWWSNCCISHFGITDKGLQLQSDCRANEINTYLKGHPENLGFLVIDDTDGDNHLSLNFGAKFICTKRENNYPLFTQIAAEIAYNQFLQQLNA